MTSAQLLFDNLKNSGSKLSETEYDYNLQCRMSEVRIDLDADNNDDRVEQYTYNDQGIRVIKREQLDTDDDGTVDTDTTTDYLIDANNPTGYAQVLEEKDASGNVIKSYTLGHDVIAQDDAPGQSNAGVKFFLYDGHGSTRGLVDPTGAIITAGDLQVFRYDAFGNRLDTNTAVTTILYSGEWTDATGLQYLRARPYEPATGRLLRVDPFDGNIQNPQSLHKYLYCHGDGINFADPTGNFEGLTGMLGNMTIRAMLLTPTGGAIGGTASKLAGGSFVSGFVGGSALGFTLATRPERLGIVFVQGLATSISNIGVALLADWMGHDLPVFPYRPDMNRLVSAGIDGFAWGVASATYGDYFIKRLGVDDNFEWLPGATVAAVTSLTQDTAGYATGSL